MESKSIFASKSFWAAILAPVFSWLAAKYGFDADPEFQAAIVGAVSAVSGIVLRVVTTTPVHIVKGE